MEISSVKPIVDNGMIYVIWPEDDDRGVGADLAWFRSGRFCEVSSAWLYDLNGYIEGSTMAQLLRGYVPVRLERSGELRVFALSRVIVLGSDKPNDDEKFWKGCEDLWQLYKVSSELYNQRFEAEKAKRERRKKRRDSPAV